MTAREFFPWLDWDPENVDGYGVPEHFFGPESDTFFALLGRMVALTSRLDTLLRLTINFAFDPERGAVPPSASETRNGQDDATARRDFMDDQDLVPRIRAVMRRVQDPDLRKRGLQLIKRAAYLRAARNRYVHTTWAVIDSERAAGNKPKRPASDTEPWGIEYVNASLSQIKRDVRKLVAVVEEMDGVAGFVTEFHQRSSVRQP